MVPIRVLLCIIASVTIQNILLAQSELSESERILIKSKGIRLKEQWDYKYSGSVVTAKGFLSSRTAFNNDGRIIEMINYKNDTAVLNVSTYSYNSDGQRIEFIKYKGRKSSILFKQTTQYNAAKQKISETGFNGEDNFMNQYIYDGTGKQMEIRYFTNKKLDERRILTYKGNETEMQVKDASGNLLSSVKTERDNKGRVTEESRMDKNQQLMEHILFTYDDRDNLITEEKKYSAKPTVKTEYVYDKSGKLLEIYSLEGDVPRYLKQSYSYSSSGNLLTEFWKSSPTSEQSFRKYTYDNNGWLLSTDCYFASYKYKVLNKFVYQTF
jgi:hypothetical protein